MLKLITMAQVRLATVKDRGATAVEYGLMVALIAAVIVAIVFFLGEQIQAAFQDTCDQIDAAGGATDPNNC